MNEMRGIKFGLVVFFNLVEGNTVVNDNCRYSLSECTY